MNTMTKQANRTDNTKTSLEQDFLRNSNITVADDCTEECLVSVSSQETPQTKSNRVVVPPNNSANSGTWETMYERLLEYQRKHGHCRVPYRYGEDPQLGAWVSTQRRSYKLLKSGRRRKTSLTPERESRLVQIGFEWSVENLNIIPWENCFRQLLEFVALNGHAQVPTKWEENSHFSSWVSRQRREYQKVLIGQPSSLTKDRIQLLNSIGFLWEAKRGGVKRQRNGSLVEVESKTSGHRKAKAESLKARAKSLLRSLHRNDSGRASGTGMIGYSKEVLKEDQTKGTEATDTAPASSYQRSINEFTSLACNAYDARSSTVDAIISTATRRFSLSAPQTEYSNVQNQAYIVNTPSHHQLLPIGLNPSTLSTLPLPSLAALDPLSHAQLNQQPGALPLRIIEGVTNPYSENYPYCAVPTVLPNPMASILPQFSGLNAVQTLHANFLDRRFKKR